VSVDSTGAEGDNNSNFSSISDDGRYVAFESDATNLLGVGNDTNAWSDIFVRDRDADGDGIYDEPGAVSTVRVSVNSLGGEGNDDSSSASISADGRYVAFESLATNLVPGGSNGSIHIFVHDRDADGNVIYDEPGGISTVQVSVDSAGSEGNGNSSSSSISDDGRYVAFESLSTNLVADDNNGSADVFVHDRDADGNGAYDEPGAISTVRVSVDLDGVQGNGNSNAPSMSADGKSVTFQSGADNLVAGDTNTALDIFVDDLQAAAGGGGGGGSSSGGGGCFIATAADGSGMAAEK
jgi:Tol biopolymer transport system component